MTNDEQVEIMGKEIDQLRGIMEAASQLIAAIDMYVPIEMEELVNLRRLIWAYEEGE